MRNVRDKQETAIPTLSRSGPTRFRKLDTPMISNSPEDLQKLILTTKRHREAQNLFFFNHHQNPNNDNWKKNWEANKNYSVKEFEHLSSVISDDCDCVVEIKRKLAAASPQRLEAVKKHLWQVTNKQSYVLQRAYIFPVAKWTHNKYLEKRIMATEMKCYRRAIRISGTERASNRETLVGV